MTLFPDLEPINPAPTEMQEKLSAGRWLTLRQKADIDRGFHPLMRGMRLAGNGETCGSCIHRVIYSYHNRAYGKCDQIKAVHSAANDCRAWWPACQGWKAKP